MTTTQKTTDVTARRRSHWWWAVPGCLAMVLLNAAISYGIVRLNAPVTAAFNMKQTVDAFFDSASQKQLSEAQSKALSARFNTALEASLQVVQQQGRNGQLRISFGSAKHPDCRGITVDELQKIQFDRLDFTNFYEDLMNNQKIPDSGVLTQKVKEQIADQLKQAGQ